MILAVVAGLSFATYAIWKQARGAAEGPAEPPRISGRQPLPALSDGERTIHTLRPGDIVSHLGTDYLVEGVLSLSDDGRVTRLYRMIDGARVRWLGARPGDESPLVLDEPEDLTIEANGPESLLHHGLPFRLAHRESVLCTALGAVGAGRGGGGPAQLFEYAGGGAARVLAVVSAGRVDAFAGERVAPHFVELLPGDGTV